jgi:hypothetical protein
VGRGQWKSVLRALFGKDTNTRPGTVIHEQSLSKYFSRNVFQKKKQLNFVIRENIF